MLTLYNYPRSGNCYKIRLFLALIRKEYQTVEVDLKGGETARPEFLKLNPRGQVPVIEDGGEIVWDSMAILVYLARTYAKSSWFPEAVTDQARVMQWLAVSENELLYGLARARAIRVMKRPFDVDECKTMGMAGLKLLEGRLAEHDWLATAQPSIADIACYPYVALAHEGDIELSPFPSVRAWMDRIKALPAYVAMPGID